MITVTKNNTVTKQRVQKKHALDYVIRVFSGSWRAGANKELATILEDMNPFEYSSVKEEIEKRYETHILPELEQLNVSRKGEGLEFGADKIPEPYEREAIRDFFRKLFGAKISISINKIL